MGDLGGRWGAILYIQSYGCMEWYLEVVRVGVGPLLQEPHHRLVLALWRARMCVYVYVDYVI